MRVSLCLTSAVFCLFLCCSQLVAQGDVLVSPKTMGTHDVPGDYRIQSAANKGGVTLVAWGTSVQAGDSIVGALRVQALVGAHSVGDQSLLNVPDARPFGFVQVISIDAAFLVIWNDRRADASGIYGQRVRTDGTLLGGEALLSKGRVVPDSNGNIWVFGKPAAGQLLVWNDNRDSFPGLFALRIDRNGNGAGNDYRLASAFKAIELYNTFPGVTFLRTGNSAAFLIDSTGLIGEHIAPSQNFSLPHNLAGDSSLVVLSGDTVQYFSSLFDQAPKWERRIGSLDSAVAGSGIVTRDSNETIHVYFFRFVTMPGEWGDSYRLTLYDSALLTPDSISAPKAVGYKAGISFSDFRFVFALDTTNHWQGEDNSLLTEAIVHVVMIQQDHGVVVDDRREYDEWSLGTRGAIVSGARYFVPIAQSLPAQHIVRSADSNSSIVRITIDSVGVNLVASSALRQLLAPRIHPGLIKMNGRLHCTWRQPSDNDLYASGTWDFPESATIQQLFRTPAGASYTWNGPGNSAVVERSSTYEIQQFLFNYNYLPVEIHHEQWSIYRLDSAGWAPRIGYSETAYYGEYLELYMVDHQTWHAFSPLAYDPNRDEFLTYIFYSAAYSPPYLPWGPPVIVASGRHPWDGWEADSVRVLELDAVVPVDSLSYIRVLGNNGLRLLNHDSLASFRMPPAGLSPVYQRLFGPFFLRRSWSDSAGSSMRLELFGLDGGLAASNTIQLASRNADLALELNRSDSSIIFLTADSSGVRATWLDQNLNLRVANARVIAASTFARNPSGVISGDSLYAVWEDYRSGVPEIYGNGVPLHSLSSSISEPVSRVAPSRATISIAPNPVHDRASIRISTSIESAVDLDFVDVLGNTIHTEHFASLAPGSYSFDVALAGIARGLYFVRYHIGGMPGVREFVVN